VRKLRVHRAELPAVAAGEKACRRCHEPLSLDSFARDCRAGDGRKAYCRKCAELYRKEWSERNPGAAAASTETWRVGNRDHVLSWKRAYNARSEVLVRHADEEARRRARRTVEQVKAERAYFRAYYQANRAAYDAHRQNRKARLLAVGGRITAVDVRHAFSMQGGTCAYCPADLTQGYEVDHKMPVSRGGSNTPENICLACRPCNRSKHAKTVDEFIAWRLRRCA